MSSRKKFIVSHAPFWHYGSNIGERSYHTMFAALPAVLWGIFQYGVPALAVVALSVSTAIFWEWAFAAVAKRPQTIGDGNAALIGLLIGMLMPAVTPWWAVLVSTFVAVVIAKQIFGGIVTVSYREVFNFDAALVDYDLGFTMYHPLVALKAFGTRAVADFSTADLLLGRQVGGIGTTFGIGLIIGGLYLILRGFIRWEISVSFLAGVFVAAALFYMADPARFASPVFHLLTGYTLIGAFFLATEDSSSPVNFIPMLIYGATGGIVTVIIRSIGAYADGVIYAILVINLVNPLIDKIRPKALGKVI
jgi:electron transport complex protein RnfD